VLSLLSRVCLSRAMALSSHSISAIIQYCYLYQHAPDTAKNHDANTACRTTSTCTNPCKLQVYKICYVATVVLLPPRVQVLRVVLLQPCPHATRYQSLLLLCSDWPVPRLCLRRNLNNLVRLPFWLARCASCRAMCISDGARV
jgi:hypothetical protein